MNPAERAIRDEITRDGAITFERFMALALYRPEGGYYERRTPTTGKAGDYYTSVSVGCVFGELLAARFREWLGELGAGPCRLIEGGAHDGTLARDILRFIRRACPDLLDRMEYSIVEPSTVRRGLQRDTLREFEPRVRWHADVTELGERSVTGIVFMNELLDAIPIRRFGWDAPGQAWYEWGVTASGDALGWCRLPVNPDGLTDRSLRALRAPSTIREVLPDGYVVEASPAAERWWRTAARSIHRGRLLSIDYGYVDAEVFAPERQRGTLRAYRNHRVAEDCLAVPGEQDLTAHVDLAMIRAAGEREGLQTVDLCSQREFLTRVVAEDERGVTGLPDWTGARRRQFQTLTHPAYLGDTFKVIVQYRSPEPPSDEP